MTGLLGLRPHVMALTEVLPPQAGTGAGGFPGAHQSLHSLMGPSRLDKGWEIKQLY